MGKEVGQELGTGYTHPACIAWEQVASGVVGGGAGCVAGGVGGATVWTCTGAVVGSVAADVGDALVVVGAGLGEAVVARWDCGGVETVAGAVWRTGTCGAGAESSFIASLALVLRTATAAIPTVTAAQRARFAPFTRET
ncbi:MAG TPA: hypothetical protein VGG75_41600 [Trebonia sp.]